MPKRVLFLNGPSQDGCDRFFGWPTPLLYAIAPTADAVLRGVLDVELVPEVFDPVAFTRANSDRVLGDFERACAGVDIVCASATYDSLHPTFQLLSRAKRAFPGITTILGGPHFDEVHTLLAGSNEGLPRSPVDFAVAGDGEFVLLDLLAHLSRDEPMLPQLTDTPGRAWLYGAGTTTTTQGRPLPLDALPAMPIEFAEVSRHRNDFDVFRDGGEILPTVQMIAKRGCAYECSFCSESRLLTYPNARSIASILSEIELRQRQGFRAVFFDDSTFGLYPKLKELLAELGRTGMVFGCLNRFNHLTDFTTVDAYRRAGFRYFYCAIEQLDDAALKASHKGQGTEKIRRGMQILSDLGIKVGVSLLYGLPGESDLSIQRTLDFTQHWVQRGDIVLVSESVLAFHPGTPFGAAHTKTFDRAPPNLGFPFDRFEEGQWDHPEHVNADYLARILSLSEQRFGFAMIRNRHSWYAGQRLVSSASPKMGAGG